MRGRRPRPAAAARRARPAGRSGWSRRPPADLLYLETVDDECAQADREAGAPAGTVPGAAGPAGARASPGDRHPRDLSEGQRLALVLAVQLAAAPPVVLLDEPTRGLDYRGQGGARASRRTLAADGRAVVVATHDVEFVAAVADRVVVMAEGEVVADGRTAEVIVASPAFAPQVAKILAPQPWLTVDQVARGAGRGGRRDRPRCRVRLRSPAGARAGVGSRAGRRSSGRLSSRRRRHRRRSSADAPLVFLVMLPRARVLIVLAELGSGGIDAKALAHARRAVRGQRRAAAARRRHRRHRDRLLPAGPGRPGVRARVRLRARGHVAVRLGAADRRGRAVAAVPDARRVLGRPRRRAAPRPGPRPGGDRDAGRRTASWPPTRTGC